MGEGSTTVTERRRESRPSVLSQAGWVMCAGGIIGILMSLVYYRAFGAPLTWLDARATWLDARARRTPWRVGEGPGGRSAAATTTSDVLAGSAGIRRLLGATGSLLLTQGGESVSCFIIENYSLVSAIPGRLQLTRVYDDV